MSRLSNLQQRVLTGLGGILLFLGLIFWGQQGSVILFASILGLSLYEFYSLSPFSINSNWRLLGTLFGLCIFSLLLSHSMGIHTISPFFAFLFISPLLLIALVFSQLKKPFETLAWIVLGWFYLISPWYCMFELGGNDEYHPGLLLGLFGLLWAADSGAYFAGKSFGKTKLYARISPKKSWEGLAGGLFSALILSWILSQFLFQYNPMQWMILAVSTTIFGTLGDFAESALKRSLDLKDSGSILPGHGGILDRFDGLFVAAPVNFLIVTFLF